MKTHPIDCECQRCGGRLELLRTWTTTVLGCRSCGAHYDLCDYRQSIDDVFEELLAHTRCDRLWWFNSLENLLPLAAACLMGVGLSDVSVKNFKLTIEYDGTHYLGWQRQAQGPTVQAEIERALTSMTGSAVTLIGAGRTDAGVHAFGQVANFRSDTRLDSEPILKGLNSLLPPDIAIRECLLVPESFHARFGAKTKIYHYRILNRETRSAIGRDYVWFIHTPLDVDAMRRAAGNLIGRHDFKAFESTGSPRIHTVRTVLAAEWTEKTGHRLTFQIEADGFLRCMVRNIVGTLIAVGRGKLSPADVSAILDAKDRKRAGATAPSRGLFLVEVKY